MLLESPDFVRLTKAVDCNNIRDLALLAFCEILLVAKMEDFARHIRQGGLFQIAPDPVSQGLRLLLYRKELQKWRDKHKKEMKFVDTVSRDRDFNTSIRYVMDNIDLMSNLIPF
jgi:hypothetical protein